MMMNDDDDKMDGWLRELLGSYFFSFSSLFEGRKKEREKQKKKKKKKKEKEILKCEATKATS